MFGFFEVDDLNIPPEVEAEIANGDDAGSGFVVPQRGQPPSFYWPNNSSLVADHVAAGSFQTAARLLKKQLGITNITPFKELFLSAYARLALRPVVIILSS